MCHFLRQLLLRFCRFGTSVKQLIKVYARWVKSGRQKYGYLMSVIDDLTHQSGTTRSEYCVKRMIRNRIVYEIDTDMLGFSFLKLIFLRYMYVTHSCLILYALRWLHWNIQCRHPETIPSKHMPKIAKIREFGLYAPSKIDLIWLETEIRTFWGVFTQFTYVHWTPFISFCMFFIKIYKKRN